MKWIDKLREGATRAADKAQRTVEVTRTTAMIAGKRKQIRNVQRLIGASVYEAYKTGDFTAAAPDVIKLSAQIDAMEREIGNLELELHRLNRAKSCVCGEVVPYSARFCPDCGRGFATSPETIEKAVDVSATLRCVKCDDELEAGDRYCLRCGSDQSASPIS